MGVFLPGWGRFLLLKYLMEVIWGALTLSPRCAHLLPSETPTLMTSATAFKRHQERLLKPRISRMLVGKLPNIPLLDK